RRRGGAGQAENLMTPGMTLLGPALGLSAILFSLGVAGVLLRRNAIVLFMCIELMLNAVNLTFVALSQLYGASGYIMVFFVMTVAAAEAAVGLAIILALFRHRQSCDLQTINLLQGGFTSPTGAGSRAPFLGAASSSTALWHCGVPRPSLSYPSSARACCSPRSLSRSPSSSSWWALHPTSRSS